MTNGIYHALRRDAFRAGILITLTLVFVVVAIQFFRGDANLWGSISTGGAVASLLGFFRTWPRIVVIAMRPDESMVEFLQRTKAEANALGADQPEREIVEKGTDQ